jgi:RNA polymerase sigma-70 factor (ECF subfamily)
VERTEILARLRERIVVFAASRIGRDAAEDIAQETLILLHEKYAHVSRLEELVPLSLQIARFKLMSVTRKAHRRGEDHAVPVDEIQVPDLNADPSLTVERRELLERLERALPQLGERCRELFRLKLQGRSFPEIQKLMQAASVNTVYTWDFRCRKQLLELLGGSWEAKR